MITVKVTVPELRALASALRIDADARECVASDERLSEAEALRKRAFYFDWCADNARLERAKRSIT